MVERLIVSIITLLLGIAVGKLLGMALSRWIIIPLLEKTRRSTTPYARYIPSLMAIVLALLLWVVLLITLWT